MSLSCLLQAHAQDPVASLAAPAFLNGSWCTLAEAKVSVLDRGFLFGDGIYEVVPVYGRRPLDWPLHQARLVRSLEAVQIQTPLSGMDWSALVQGLIDREPATDQFIYCQVTRGVAKRDHAFPRPAAAPTVFATTTPLKRPDAQTRSQGLKAILRPDLRWQRCDIKSIALLANVLAREEAIAAGAHEAILVRDGLLTEGAASNIWLVKAGALLGPEPSGALLEGIRRATLPQLAHALQIPLHLRPLSEQDIREADEILLTSATKEVLAITSLEGVPVGTGLPGPVYAALSAAYDQRIEACRNGTLTELAP